MTTYNENGGKDILNCQQLVGRQLVDAIPAVINKAIDAIQNLTTKDFQGRKFVPFLFIKLIS